MCARLLINSQMSHPRCYGLEKSVTPDLLRKPMVKFEVTGDERLTRTFLEGHTDVEPTESSTTAVEGRTRVSFPAKTVFSILPLYEEKVTLQLVVNMGKHPNHDGGISEGQSSACAGGPGEST